MEFLRKYHNSIKRGIINKQNGRVVDVGSGQGGDISKYMRNTKITKVLLVEPELKKDSLSERGDVLQQRLEEVRDKEKFELVASRLEDLELEIKEKFDYVNMFFCANHLDLDVVVEKLNLLLKKSGVVFGIAMFEEDVVYVQKNSFRLLKEDDMREIHIPGSYVTDIKERTMTFKYFHEKMCKYFCCVEISKLRDREDIGDDEKLLNSMYSKFMYVRNYNESLKDISLLSGYLMSYVEPLVLEGHDMELELRRIVSVDLFESLKRMIKFSEPFNNSYTYYDLHVYDQRLREYDNGDVDLKSLLFRKLERICGVSYHVCLSSEVKEKGQINNKIRKGKVVMKRWIKKLEWGEIAISARGKRYDLEVEFEGIVRLDTARRFMISIMKQYMIDFNIPTSLALESDVRTQMIKKNYIKTKKYDGKRVFIFAVKGLGIWSWDQEQNIELLNSFSSNDIVIDATLNDNEYIVTDVVDDKTTYGMRLVAAEAVVETWKRLYNLRIRMSAMNDINTVDLYVSPKSYSYNSFIN